MKLCISPCPNDTFAFYGLLHGKVSVDIDFDVEFYDIDKLNTMAKQGNVDVCKVSAAVVKDLKGYRLLNSGAAIGYGNAPLFVAKKGLDKPVEECVVAIPGLETTAYALLKHFFPKVSNVRVAVFSDIMDMVESGEVDAGVIIHEGRFVYQKRNLELIADFGQMWQEQMKMPIPLGCIVAKESLGETKIKIVEKAIRESVKYALTNPEEPMDFVMQHAQEISTQVQKKHITTFVNDFTVDMGDLGRKAIKLL